MNTNLLNSLAQKLIDSLPSELSNLHSDLQEQFKQIIAHTLSQLDLVTREEFDVQTKVLARTRIKLEQISQQLDKISHNE